MLDKIAHDLSRTIRYAEALHMILTNISLGSSAVRKLRKYYTEECCCVLELHKEIRLDWSKIMDCSTNWDSKCALAT